MSDDILYGQTGGQHPLARWIDSRETYGPRLIERFVSGLHGIETVVDIGAGSGRDLAIVKQAHPTATTIAIEAGREYADALRGKADHVHVLDIERDPLPVPPDSVDLILANQVLEHTKEVFWIFDQVTRSLRIGGYFLFGVPNVASLHNRALLMLGRQPTQHKLCSAHIRPFSKKDTLKFLEACFPQGYRLADFGGAQFYPFPAVTARFMAGLFPTMAFSIFFLLRKLKPYTDEFVTYPARARFETNFWTGTGDKGAQSQYAR